MKLTRRATTAGLLSFAAAAPALAQAKRTVTIVVPFPPGGSVDALARLMQEGLQERLGANIIIENKAGANGSLGAAQVARAAPDGNTLMVTFDSHSTIPALIDKPLLNVETDLVPVMMVGKAPYVVATSVKKPYKTFADVINISVSETLSRTLLTSGATMLSVLAFLIWGTGVIKDFALAMIIGIVAGTYSSIYVAAPLTEWIDSRFFHTEAADPKAAPTAADLPARSV